jgi:hypothetical protein
MRCTALAARRAETYWIKSASFRTSGKEIVTWFTPADRLISPGRLTRTCSMEAEIRRHCAFEGPKELNSGG